VETKTDVVKVQLDNGAVVHIETAMLGGDEEVAFGLPQFDAIGPIVEGIAGSVEKMLCHVKPSKASVEFGLELALETGQLTALLVKGSGTSSMKITLEWGGGDK